MAEQARYMIRNVKALNKDKMELELIREVNGGLASYVTVELTAAQLYQLASLTTQSVPTDSE